MRAGLTLGYFDTGAAGRTENGPRQVLELTRAAESAGVSVVWASEAYGSDAPTVLAWLAAQTTRIDVGAAVMQIPARSATATAMTAATLDVLSAGRFRLGLGVSGPQVSEGWHGVRFDAPLARTAEYVDVVRLALARRPLEYAGEHLRLPLPDGPGVPLRLAMAPPRADLPVYLAAVGPRNVGLTGAVADGWLPVFFSPEHSGESREALARGRARCQLPGGAQRPLDIAPSVPVLLTDDPAVTFAADVAPLRAHAALYLGGMGSRRTNFYARLASAMGFADAVDAVQENFLAGRHRQAALAVPAEFLTSTCLVGAADSVAERLAAYAAAGVTTLSLAPMAASAAQRVADLRAVVAAGEKAGVWE